MESTTEDKGIEEKMIEILFDTSSDSSNNTSEENSDSEEEVKSFDELMLVLRNNMEKKQQVKPAKLDVEKLVDCYNGVDFKNHFRVTRTTYEHLLNILGERITRKATPGTRTGGHPFTEPKKQLLLALRVLGNPESYRLVCNQFKVGRATGIRTVRRVVDALFEIAPQTIRWTARNEQQSVSVQFAEMAGIPGVVGCIGRCQIPIQAPYKKAKQSKTDSVILQGVCNANKMFTHCYIREVGSAPDAQVLHDSGVNSYLHEESEEMFLNKDYHLLGDATYPVLNHLLTPYEDDGNLTEQQQNFNSKLSSTRTVLEQAFGELKGRWRRLKRLNVQCVDSIPKTVVACCVLHNICIMRDDPNFEWVPENDGELAVPIHDENEQAGEGKRVLILNQIWIPEAIKVECLSQGGATS